MRLELQSDNQSHISMELRTKLNSLWDRLKIDVTHREHFVCSKKGIGKGVIRDVNLIVLNIFYITY